MSTTKAISQAERSSIWMTRGDIVLQTENTQFRVNSDVLAQQSPLFAKMFELPQPPAETEPSVDGCPVIHVSDSARDWENILSVLYSPFRVREKISFDLLASMLRLGDKYDLSESKSYAIWRLRAEFPSELATWLGLRGGFSKIAGQVDGTGRILDLFQLAWQFRVQTCIPVIGYCCLNEIPMKAILDNEKVRDDGTHIALPALLKAQLVIALEELKEAQHKGPIPQELIDSIIGTFTAEAAGSADHKMLQDLRACSLAARAFVRPCQERIFHTVRLYHSPHNFCVRGSMSSVVNRTTQLADLLAESPHLAPYVKTIHVAYPSGIPDDDAGDNYLRALADIFAALTAVETLQLQPRAVDYEDLFTTYAIPRAVEDAIFGAAACASFRRLVFTRTRFGSMTDLEDIMCAAPNLRQLALREILIFDEDDEHETPRVRAATCEAPPVLDAIELRVAPSHFYQEALECFRHRGIIANLRSVYFDEYDDLILQTNESTLVEMWMIRRHGQDVRHVGTGMLEALCGEIATTIHLGLSSNLTNLYTGIQHIRQAMSTHPLFCHDKTVAFYLRDAGLLYQLMSDIDDLLAGERIHPGPKRVPIIVGFQDRDAVQRVKELMPRLWARGLLDIQQLSRAQYDAVTRKYRCRECYDD
ncbi:hypothetical protein MKEN_00460300 [Mycena kentingensis (nom. inval.)]|nr:hypothetical protein MKEN_00460300 [Mycena kentingensis (nom. inval.)]